MDIRLATVYVYQGKAYVPAQARIESGGPFLDIDPVSEVNLTSQEIVRAVKSVLSIGYPIVPNPFRKEFRKEWKKRKEPILTATGARNWSKLYRKGINYTIEWSSKGIALLVTRPGTREGWEFDPDKRREFASDTDLKDIVEVIMADIEARSGSRLARM